ncbi:MAG: hypothetical protein ACRECM_04220, partial [Methyloceanibacter sp.]
DVFRAFEHAVALFAAWPRAFFCLGHLASPLVECQRNETRRLLEKFHWSQALRRAFSEHARIGDMWIAHVGQKLSTPNSLL